MLLSARGARLRVKATTEILPIALYAALAILVVPVFPHFTSPNEVSRWVAAVAIVDHHRIDVTPVLAATGLRNIEDLSAIDGRTYSNKAPGPLLLAVPAYAITRGFTGPASAANLRPTLNAMRLAGATIPMVLLAWWMARIARHLGCDARRIRVAVVVLLFATPLFAYGLLFFAHALSALALFGAWALLLDRDSTPRGDVAAGAMIGLAVLAEYPNAIPAAVLGLCALPRLRVAGSLRVFAGGLPFALALAAYNHLAFGSVFTLSSAHESNPDFRALADSGLFGIGIPSPDNLLALLADPSKGLLVLSPVLVLAALGVAGARRALTAPAFIGLVAAPLSILVTMAGYPNWHGGWTVGARYLAAAIPFAVLLIAFARETTVEAFFAGASIAVIAVLTLVFPFVPPDYAAPWISFSWPILRQGLLAPNLLHLVWRPLAIIVPFAIVLAALAMAVRPRRLVVAAAGIAVWFAAGLAVEQRRQHPPAIRAYVEEVHFGRKDAIRATLPPGPGRARLEQMARQASRLPPPDWPF